MRKENVVWVLGEVELYRGVFFGLSRCFVYDENEYVKLILIGSVVLKYWVFSICC